MNDENWANLYIDKLNRFEKVYFDNIEKLKDVKYINLFEIDKFGFNGISKIVENYNDKWIEKYGIDKDYCLNKFIFGINGKTEFGFRIVRCSDIKSNKKKDHQLTIETDTNDFGKVFLFIDRDGDGYFDGCEGSKDFDKCSKRIKRNIKMIIDNE